MTSLTPEQMTNMANLKQALLSGRYEQGRSSLKTTENKYCCLGVGAEVVGIVPEYNHGSYSYTFNGSASYLRDADANKFGLDLGVEDSEKGTLAKYDLLHPSDRQGSLAVLNDKGYSFRQIVEIIEELGWDE